MKKIKKVHLLSLLLLFSGFYSCAPKQYEIVDIAETPAILQSAASSHDHVRSLRGIASVRIESPGDSASFTQATIAESPNSFRLEIIAAFGRTIAVLASDGQRVFLTTSRDEVVFEDVHRFNLSYFYPGIPREITAVVLTDLLLGKIPFGLWDDDFSLTIDSGTGMLVIGYINGIGTYTTAYLNPVKERIEKAEIDIGNDTVVDITYSDFHEANNATFPRRMELTSGAYTLRLTYRRTPEINPVTDRNLFKP